MRPLRLLTLPLLLTTAASSPVTRVHVQSSPGDIGPLSGSDTDSDGPVNYGGHQVIKVVIADSSTVDLLRSYEDRPGVQFWTLPSVLASTVDVMVSPEVRRQLTAQLTDMGVSYNVSIGDVQEAITRDSPVASNAERNRVIGHSGHPLTWTSYHRLADHHQYLDYIARNYRGLCDTFSIGTSSEGRDLKGIKCGLGQKKIWIDGGIHAREWISPAVVSYLIREFSERSFSHRNILMEYTIYFIPVLNPDGYEFTFTNNRLWRKTRSVNPGSRCRGTDPNRNFDIEWGKAGTSKDPCSDIYGGRRAFSEPETNAVKKFLLKHADTLTMYLTFHSYSQLLFVPYGYSTAQPPDYDELYKVAVKGSEACQRVHGTYHKVGQASSDLYSSSGGSDDWAKAVAGIKYSYTFELRDKGRYGFLLPAYQIEPTGEEIIAAVVAMIEAI